jgi:DNA-binding CsgD family transcriptional regulator
MLPHLSSNNTPTAPETYPLGEEGGPSYAAFALALVSLSHTPIEQRIYAAMLASVLASLSASSFTTRELISLTGVRSATTIRRALDGLLVKLSIERVTRTNGNGKRADGRGYRVYTPVEVLSRRKQNGSGNGDLDHSRLRNGSFERAVARVAENPLLSRREAQVALCCVEGLTNAQIGKRLEVSEQTVKFHLRHVFVKFGVKRRAELISRLLM